MPAYKIRERACVRKIKRGRERKGEREERGRGRGRSMMNDDLDISNRILTNKD
jgi:hypothetical protein